jgi:hypothetical protein
MFFYILVFSTLLVITHIGGSETRLQSVETKCTVQHNGLLFNENERVIIQDKSYKVEDCQLQRSYQACGGRLWYMINIVCEAIKVHNKRNRMKSLFRRFVRQKSLTESCCETSCTVVEMTRYCPRQ